MSIRTSAWSIYDIFESKDAQQVFVAVVSDTQWRQFCEHFELSTFAADESLAANSDRVGQRERIIPAVQDIFSTLNKSELMEKLEAVTIPGGPSTRLPALPLQMGGQRFGVSRDVPLQGQDILEVLQEAGYDTDSIEQLIQRGIVAAAPPNPDEGG
jgi:crotonobetainyl-CoA:carnitine CoA-transferase CaiB-like acyl-CoA transferase